MTAELIPDLDEEVYHRLPSLSASGAKLLLEEGGPAKYQWRRTHREPPRADYEEGSAFHTLMLGAGDRLVEVDADSWRTKAAKDEATRIRSERGIPLLPREYKMVHDMRDSAMEHPVVAQLFSTGQPEQSIKWTDEATDVQLRCRPDWLRDNLVVDLKSSKDASPRGFAKSAAQYGYDIQDQFYRDGVRQQFGYGEDVAFCFVVTEKEEPYHTAVYELDDEAVAAGYGKYRRAVEIFRDCTESGIWPAYGTGIQKLTLPRWATYEWDAA